MATVLLTTSVILLLAMAIAQLIGVRLLSRKVDAALKGESELLLGNKGSVPKTAVLLSLRGADPDLAIGLEALGRQSHPDYQVVIVVDHPNDPAWDLVNEVAARLPEGRIRVDYLRERRATCGLKCSALAQAYRSLDPSVSAIALVDADIVVHHEWLEQLVAPLSDPKVGVASGAQWFEPEDTDSGTWMRSIWNAGASVPTIFLGHPWAGSCAMRKSDMERMQLVARWERSIIDDGPIAEVASEMGLEVRFVPRAWMINREHCSRRFVGTYLKRMLTWSRLYEKTYPITVGHAVATVLIWGLAWLGMLQGLVWGEPWRIAVGASAALLFWIFAIAGYWSVRRIVARTIRARGQILKARTWADRFRVLWLVPTTYLIYAWASVAALFVKRVQWRGVEYVISAQGVRMTHYEPYRVGGSGSRSSVGTPKVALSIDSVGNGWGPSLLMVGMALQVVLLLQASWSPRYAAVIVPASVRGWTPVGSSVSDVERPAIGDPEEGVESEGGESGTSLPAETSEDSTSGEPIANVSENDPTVPTETLGTESPANDTQDSQTPTPLPTNEGQVRIINEPESEGLSGKEAWGRIDRFTKEVDQLLASVTDVEGTLIKQERIAGRLEPLTQMKFRQLSQPLSIHLLWTDVARGREVLFRTEADGTESMIARQETVLGALVPTVSLSKNHPFTRTVSAHPIDELSTSYLRAQIRRYLVQAKRNPEAIIELAFEECVDESPCARLSIVHPNRSELAPAGYHRVDMYFSGEDRFPIRWEKYHWPGWQGARENAGDAPPLLEYFRLQDYRYNVGLTSEHFRNDLPEYGFGKAPVVPLE